MAQTCKWGRGEYSEGAETCQVGEKKICKGGVWRPVTDSIGDIVKCKEDTPVGSGSDDKGKGKRPRIVKKATMTGRHR